MTSAFLAFLRSSRGLMVGAVVLIFVVGSFVRERRERLEENHSAPKLKVMSPIEGEMTDTPEDKDSKQDEDLKETREWARTTPVDTLRVPPYRPQSSSPVPQPPTKPSTKPMTRAPLVLFQRKSHSSEKPQIRRDDPQPVTKTLDAELFGTVIRVQLLSGIQSSDAPMPILAKVTHDVHARGQVIIPKGCEIHGTVQPGRLRDRVRASGRWVIVLKNGRRLELHGIALHQDQDPDTEAYGPEDMSVGLKGRLLKTDALMEYKQFAAAVLSAVSRSSRRTVRGIFGEEDRRDVGNALRDGVDAVAERYLRRLEEQIQGDGYYVSVPASTKFYVTVRDTQKVTVTTDDETASSSRENAPHITELLKQRDAFLEKLAAEHIRPPTNP